MLTPSDANRPSHGQPQRRSTISLGTHLDLGIELYSDFIRDLPGFKNLRSPWRAGVLVQVALVPLAALGADATARLIGRVARARAATVACSAAFTTFAIVQIAEVATLPQTLHKTTPEFASSGWVAWLARQERRPGDAIAMVPFAADSNYQSYESTTLWMLASLDHGWPIVNGYSGFFPPEHDDLEQHMRDDFPDDVALDALRAHNVRYLVVPTSWEAEHSVDLHENLDLREVYREGSTEILELLPE